MFCHVPAAPKRGGHFCVGQCNGGYVLVSPNQASLGPSLCFKLSLSLPDDSARTVNQSGLPVGVASLVDTQQSRLAPTSVRLGYEAQPCGHLSAIVEVFRIPYRGHQRTGGYRPNTRNFRQLAVCRDLCMPGFELHRKLAYLTVKLVAVRHQAWE
jgi:hypothetical protein